MKLEELKIRIDKALDECQRVIENHPNAILSEADLERLMSSLISREIGENVSMKPEEDDFSVHTQVSHYFDSDGRNTPDKRVDILLLKESILQRKYINHKEFNYEGESFAIELKYLHRNDDLQNVKCDFCKWERLKSDSWLYVVVAIDADNDENFNRKKEQIDRMKLDILNNEEHPETCKLFHTVLKKSI